MANPDAADIAAGGFLKGVLVLEERRGNPLEYPWSLPAVRRLRQLDFHPHVTFFVGDNGTGKSTLLEAVAQLAGYDQEGGSRNFKFANREYWSELGGALRPVRGVRREKDGFFLRAESFFNVATRVEEYAREGGSQRYLQYYGGRSPHEQSHGESFLSLATNRFAGEGLYVLDEPEAALSPAGQLAFLRILHVQSQGLGSQFIIATHSPLIMAYPAACIYHFTPEGIAPVEYEATNHFQLTRDFLNHRDRYFRSLFADWE